MERFPFRPSRKKGQNILVDERVLDFETDLLECSGKTVLEIGAGTGNWTEKLAKTAKRVWAVEKDERLAYPLRKRLGGFPNVEIIIGDALELDLPPAERVASNVPYAISSSLLEKLSSHCFERGVLCLQKEFVDRMLAQPGDRNRSRLSVTTQLRFRMEKAFEVPPSAFKPAPKVSSTVIVLEPTGFEPSVFFKKFLRAAFEHKRKKLLNALVDSAHELKADRKEVERAMKQSRFASKRAIELTNEELASASEELEKALGQ